MARCAFVFVNHSSHNVEELAFVKKVCDELEKADPEIDFRITALLDRRVLNEGDDWNQELHECMAGCDCGVLLLRDGKLDRDWVVREATILVSRHILEPGFRLIPVRLPGVTTDKLATSRLGHLDLQTIQDFESEEPVEIARRVKQRLKDARGQMTDTPLDAMIRKLAGLLMQADDQATTTTLEKIAGQLGLPEPQIPRPGHSVEQSAYSIVRSALRWKFGALNGLSDLIDKLNGTTLGSEHRLNLLRELEPYWVNSEAASLLPKIAEFQQANKPDESRAAAMNGESVLNFTAEMYVRRAFPLSNDWYLDVAGVIPEDGGGVDSLIDEIRSVIREKRQLSVPSSLCEAERAKELKRKVDKKLTFFQKKKTPYFVALPLGAETILTADEFKNLTEAFPSITFIFETGLEEPMDLPPHVERLRPLLSPEDESNAEDEINHARHMITGE